MDDRARLWRTAPASREPTLIIADNASSASQVRPLLPGATSAHRVVVTSRDRLADLDGARSLHVGVLPRAEAVRMLADTIGANDPDDVRASADVGATARVADLPLALRVAAAPPVADPDRSLPEMADAPADDRRRLEVLHYDGSLAVRAAFDLSYRNLRADHARLFRLLGLHPSGDLGTEAVTALAGIDVPRARDVLRHLARAHVVQPAAVADTWAMHDLLRACASELGAADAEREEAVKRLIDLYARACRDTSL